MNATFNAKAREFECDTSNVGWIEEEEFPPTDTLLGQKTVITCSSSCSCLDKIKNVIYRVLCSIGQFFSSFFSTSHENHQVRDSCTVRKVEYFAIPSGRDV